MVTTIAPLPSIIIAADDPPHQLTATYPAYPRGGTDILWEAFPADQVQFANRTTQTTAGGFTQNTITYTGEAPFTAYISASTFNAKTGTRDYGTLQLRLGPAGQQTWTDRIVVTSAGDLAPLFTPYTLTAQHTGTQQTVNEVVWSVDRALGYPDGDTTHTFRFDPPRSQLTGNGGTTGTTQLTVLGPNADVIRMDFHARPSLPNAKVWQFPKLISFEHQPTVPAGASLNIVSVDGDPLQDGNVYHLFQAAYINNDGTRATTQGWNGTITWGPLNDPNLTWLTTDPTPTDANGIATNALMRKSAGDVTVTAQATGTPDKAPPLKVTFVDGATQQPFQGSMTITPPAGPLTLGQPYQFSVQYRGAEGNPMPNNTMVTWSGAPADRLTFSNGSGGGTGNTSYTTGGNGIATIQVTASDGADIPSAVIGTTGLFTRPTGSTDHSDPDVTVSFQQTQSSRELDLWSPDTVDDAGYTIPMTSLEWHVLQATYKEPGGAPIKGQPLTWTPSGSIILASSKGHTNQDGVMTNAMQCTTNNSLQTADVTVSADGTNDSNTQEFTFTVRYSSPQEEGQGMMIIKSAGGPTLPLGEKNDLSVTYYQDAGQTLVRDGTEITWIAYPSDRLTFGDGTPGSNKSKTTGGVATIQVTASEGDDIESAVVGTSAINPSSGLNDHAWPDLVLQFQAGQQTQADKIIVSSAGDTAPLYAPYTLTAEHTGTQENVTAVEWSVDPGQDTTHTFRFVPQPSPLTGNGGTTGTTQITAVGPNADVTVTVYAYPNPPDPKVQLVPKTLTFKAQQSVPAGASVSVCSVDGDPLQDGNVYHLFQAAYLNNDGTKATTPEWDGTITWGPPGDSNLTWLTTDPTPTDANGIATNALMGTSSGDVTVTAQATGTPDQAPLTVTFVDHVTQQPGQGTMTITPPAGTLTLGQPYQFSVQYLDSKRNPMPNGTVVTWAGAPLLRLTFGGGSGGGVGNTSYTTGGNGVATIQVTASDGPDIPTAVIGTTGLFNQQTGFPDHSDPDVTVSFKAAQQQPDKIIVSAGDTAPLYAPFTLTAQHTGTQENVTAVEWSVDPGQDTTHTFRFVPQPSPLTGNGGTTGTTQITAVGPNADVTVTVYAYPTPPDPQVQVVPKTLTFKQQPSVPAGASLNIVSVDGDPLQDGNAYHLFQAAYINNDGTIATTQGWDGTITWGPPGDSNLTWLTTDPTPTDANGIATNALMGKGAGDVTVTAQATGTSDKAPPLTVTFVDDATQPGQGSMTITPPAGPLTLGHSYQFSVRYLDSNGDPMLDNVMVTWSGAPDERLTFSNGSGDGAGNTSYTTGGNGIATIQVTASEGADIPTAVIGTTGLFNPQTGFPDHSDPDVTVSFKAAQQTQELVGILVDKAYAWSSPSGHKPDRSDQTQRIKCQVQVLGASGSQKVELLNSKDAPVLVYNPAPPYAELDGPPYYVETDAETGQASFLLASTNYTFFTLQAQLGKDPAISSDLVLARNVGRGSLPTPPKVPDLQNGTLSIPPTAPTFQVFIPVSDRVAKGEQVALLLNDRVVWEGAVDQDVPVEVAYANLVPSGNMLCYVTQNALESYAAGDAKNGFPTSGGPALTGPGNVVRTLPAPTVVVKAAPTVGPGDILGQGLEIDLLPYPGVAEGDLVTVYCYTSGTDVLTSKPVKTIVPLAYQVLTDGPLSPLLSGNKAPVYLPQWAAAGYANGQLQVDYKVVSNTTRATNPRWSNLSQKYTLNTTI